MFACRQPKRSRARIAARFGLFILIFGVWFPGTTAPAADLEAARGAFRSGRYDQCIAKAQEAIKAGEDVEDWGVLLTDSLLIRGRYAQALVTVTNALATESRSIRLRWSARRAFLFNGNDAAATETTAEIQRLFTSRYWLYRNSRDLVVFGRVALEGGMEPKLALDRIYDAARKVGPKIPDAYLASGELALEKHDFGLAARYFQDGLKEVPDDPDLYLGVARAFAPSDQRLMLASLEKALEQNSNHVSSLLLLADHSIDAEDYSGAEKLLAQIDSVNPAQPEAWAYRAVIAHLRNQAKEESRAHELALKFWDRNPRVDNLIGQKLSQKYRFAEGAAYQRRALALHPDYLPAKSQLAQDLLRLGEEEEGWRLADEVQHKDSYDVAANNLMTLRDVLARFQTLTNQHFMLRMHPREAALYGHRALGLLEQARARLCSQYGMEFSRPVLVEMFNEEKDFAVRTFGMPDNDGFLGVCFGHVITANSPGAKPGSHFNWESMLWHEFCHVVTLQLTGNKMPRWISEGISVYEERQANPAWGEHLIPRYREMLLDKSLIPISKLSGAFLAPKSGVHLQFAYYQSSLVVQFIVERFGRDKLVAALRDLATGVELNDALAKYTAPMEKLEKDFEVFARKVAVEMAPGVDLDRPTTEQLAGVIGMRRGPGADSSPEQAISESAWEIWAKVRPTNYWVMLREAERLAEEKEWREAKPLLQRLVQLYPGSTGSSSPYRRLATAYRALGETNAEREVLVRFAAQDDQAPDVYLRLMELASEAADWPQVLTNAQRYLAVDPLVPAPYRFLARASEASGELRTATDAYRALLQLDPSNPADVHFQLGRLLYRQHDTEARRHVLEALGEAPRYREALRLLRQMVDEPANPASQTTANAPSPQ